ncbi:hypothetical protein SAMN05421812_11124 [Asanoa hainanensis]|uniref:Peptidoglycan binding domain-containing protein n=1 Tax=Asanoa hainanensis TaxID=560556 RepID=A0A239NV39_9ACTN|nr:peptidoglycan-binding domain-containing protein [Asanoa hainanensis]SNT58572.1 hypothetical protein SAMN05421812_11124 [Asanoa hainanensis]
MVKSKVLRWLAVAVVAAGLHVLAPGAAHAATPQCNGSGVLIRNGNSAWIPAYQSSNFNCWLGRGSHNSGVGELQRNLNDIWGGTPGYTMLSVDNDYGPRTESMVRFAQQQYKNDDRPWVSVDGGYGPQTRGLICWTTFNTNACITY